MCSRIICERCKKEIFLSEKLKQKRLDHGFVENLCSTCFRYVKTASGKLTPDALYFGVKSNPFVWEMFLKNKDVLKNSTKLFVEVTCCKCGKSDIRRVDKIVNSKYAKDMQICNDCVMSYVCNLDDWKTVNSNAQKKVQSKEETKDKIRNSLAKLKEKDKHFSLKRSLCNSRFLKGFYKGMFFASAYELSFLIEHKNERIDYCFDTIPYLFKGKQHSYTPDFMINDKIYEIKGQFSERDNVKINAAKELLKDKFIVLDKTSVKYHFDSLESLNEYKEDLIITNFPKKIEDFSSELYIDNHPKILKLREKLLSYSESQAREVIAFYVDAKKLKIGNDFKIFYENLVKDNLFIEHLILFNEKHYEFLT